MMKTDLNKMMDDLSKHHRDKEKVLYESIEERLTKSLETYEYEASQSLRYIKGKNKDKVIKKITKM